MTQEEILEGNKLIAKFMGGKLIKNKYTGNLFSDLIVYGINSNVLFHENKLQYHSSWDWLMPVVEKIEKTIINDMDITIEIQHNTCFLNGNFPAVYSESKTKLESTFICIVKFIKWYNKNKQ